MPRNRDYDDEFDDDDEDDEGREPKDPDKLVRHLRRQVKERDKRLSEVEKALSEFSKKQKHESVEEVLKGAEVDPRYARWAVRDLDDQEPTKEAVLKWVQDNAELVGRTPDAGSTVDEGTQQGLQKIQAAERGAKGAEADPIAAKLSDPNLTAADLAALIGKPLVG